MRIDIRVPRENANDDVVRVVRWLVKSGDYVRGGATVAEVETSKSVVDVTAPADGRLAIVITTGKNAAVGSAIGTVESGGGPTSALPVTTWEPTAADSPSPRAGHAISNKAREKLAAHGLDESVVAHLAIVRESDVDALIASRAPATAVPQQEASSVGTADLSPAAPYRAGGLLGDATRSAADRNANVLWLAWNYFWRNWLLGNLVRVAPVGIRNVFHRWRGVKMGRDCFIDPNAILETAYPENITLGDDVRVTAGAIVMTHIKAPHLLRDRGYVPTVLKPVVLSSHCFIGVNAVVMPGVTVGEGAVVTSGSVVLSDVPAFTMVSGNPAKIVKRFTDD